MFLITHSNESPRNEKTYNDLNSVSCPSSFGSSPDKSLMPTVLEIKMKLMIMNIKKTNYIGIWESINVITCVEYGFQIQSIDGLTSIASESDLQWLLEEVPSSNSVPSS